MLNLCRLQRLFIMPAVSSPVGVCIRCLMLVVFFSSSANADRLDAPAIKTPRATSGLLLDIAKAGDRLVAVGDQGVILLSDTQGRQWQQADVPTSVMLTAVTFVTDSIGWAVGHDGVLLRTSDAGLNWRVVMTGNELNALQVEQFQRLVDTGGDSAMPELAVDELSYYLDDAIVAQEDGPSLPLLNVFFSDSDHGFVMGAYGLLIATQDGGDSWKVLSHRVPNPDRFHLNAMIGDAHYLYLAGEAGILYRSGDQGEHWEALDSPYEGSFFDINVYRGEVLLAGLRGHLFTSPDQGITWEQVAIDTPSTLSAVASRDNQSLLIAGQGGSVLLGEQSHRLQLLNQSDRRGWSAAVPVKNGWVLVGEKGVKLIDRLGEAISLHASEQKGIAMRAQP